MIAQVKIYKNWYSVELFTAIWKKLYDNYS